jgi:hypothetical protein
MKLADFIPQEVNRLKKEHNSLGEEVEKRLKDLLTSEGDSELDDELAMIILDQHKKIYDYNEISQKVYGVIWDACQDFYRGGLKWTRK